MIHPFKAVRYIKKPQKLRQCDYCLSTVVENAVRLFYKIDSGATYSRFLHRRCYELEKMGYECEDLEESNPFTQWATQNARRNQDGL